MAQPKIKRDISTDITTCLTTNIIAHLGWLRQSSHATTPPTHRIQNTLWKPKSNHLSAQMPLFISSSRVRTMSFGRNVLEGPPCWLFTIPWEVSKGGEDSFHFTERETEGWRMVALAGPLSWAPSATLSWMPEKAAAGVSNLVSTHPSPWSAGSLPILQRQARCQNRLAGHFALGWERPSSTF